LKDVVNSKLSPTSKGKTRQIKIVKKILNFVNKHYDRISTALKEVELPDCWDETKDQPCTLWSELARNLRTIKKLKEEYTKRDKNDANTNLLSCRTYRRATTPYLKLFKNHSQEIDDNVHSLMKQWDQINSNLRATCR